MAVLSMFRGGSQKAPAEAEGQPEKESAVFDAATVEGGSESSPAHPDEDLQRGVQQVEAVTLSWSKTTLILVFLKSVLHCPKVVLKTD